MQEKNTKRLKIRDFNICPNILHADADAETEADASNSSSALKCRRAKHGKQDYISSRHRVNSPCVIDRSSILGSVIN